MNYTTLTLGELLTHTNETIKRNAMSILKTLQKGTPTKCKHKIDIDKYCVMCDTFKNGICGDCGNYKEIYKDQICKKCFDIWHGNN